MAQNIQSLREQAFDVWKTGAEHEIRTAIESIAEEVGRGFEEQGTEAILAINKKVDAKVQDLLITFEAMKQEAMAYKRVTIVTPFGERKIKGTTHEMFHKLLNAMQTSFPVMLVGPAGTGKTYAAEQVANTLNLKFESISVGSQTSKSDLLGFMSANNLYVGTGFRRAYEHGGVFLMDEIDAGNPNVLIVLNSALAGSSCAFPDGMVTKHDDFKFIGTANTYGLGASRQYVGRNQIDAATLDRFVTLAWTIDENLESAMIGSYKHGKKWHAVIKQLRREVTNRDFRVIISPRATMKGAQLFELGFAFEEVVEMTVLATASEDQKSILADIARKHWR